MMTEERPRPEYGEYATPEQQHAAKRTDEPFVPVAAPTPVGQSSSVGDQSWPGPLVAPQRPQSPTQTPPPAAVVQKPARRWDLIVSAGLLGYGLFSVISGFPVYADPVTLLNQIAQLQGLGHFSPSALATALGIVINATSAVIWVVTAAITYRLLRRGRLAFYVPVIGGVLVAIVGAVCMLVIMLSDPSFIDSMTKR
jgi:hypothetical protein